MESLKKEINDLKTILKEKEDQLCLLKEKTNLENNKLSNDDILRYSRQLILPEIGIKGQMKLKNSSALVVGAGGLGCPASLYLVSSGLGYLGIVDYDCVETSNLHRQTLHTEDNVGLSKANSAKLSLLKINSNTKITTYITTISSTNALEIIRNYDIVLDCTDNVPTRYLLNDACVISKKPLISGSALQFEGQLTVYCHKDSPCYRCLFPMPPPPETVTNCSDGGVLGPVTGVIGSLQALESIKVLLDMDGVLGGRLLIFDGRQSTFRTVKLRNRHTNCHVCSDKPIITDLFDYEKFCGAPASDKEFKLTLLDQNERITVIDYKAMVDLNVPHILVDVRVETEYEISKISHSLNIPLKRILDNTKKEFLIKKSKSGTIPVIFICRRGNDSQLAVKHLRDCTKHLITSKDIIGGLYAWHKEIDKSIPLY